jgi:hypothetical protein
MKQFLALAAVTVAATVGTLCAGPLTYTVGGATFYEIGDGTNGLTQQYITGSTAANGGADLVGTGFYGKSYDNRLFLFSTEGTTTPVPYTGYRITGSQTGSIPDAGQLSGAYDTGVAFQMINDACNDSNSNVGGTLATPVRETCPLNGGSDQNASSASTNVWMATSPNATVTVPVGVFDATNVYTMLSNLWGQAGANDTSITFNFGTSANGSVAKMLTLNLVNASNNGSASGQIGTALECAGGCNGAALSFPNVYYATSPLAGTSVLNGVGANTDAVTVYTDTVFSTAYNNGSLSTYKNTTGNAVLSDQNFVLPFYSADPYLVSITINELNGAMGVSATTLSAITVESAPEPSTILMLITGLGALGAVRFRFRKG